MKIHWFSFQRNEASSFSFDDVAFIKCFI